MKIKLSALLFLILIFFTGGCYDDKEIDETAYMIAIGVDARSHNGYTYTFQFSAPLETVSGEGGSGVGEGNNAENTTVRNLVINATDFYTAQNIANNFLSKNVDMSHLKLIVFSSAVDQSGFLKHSQFLLREREVRPHTSVALIEGSAEEYLKGVNPELEANTAKYYELMSLRSNNVYSPSKSLSQFVDELSGESGISVLPLAWSSSSREDTPENQQDSLWISSSTAKVKSGKAELKGLAIFKNGELSAISDGDFAMIYNILGRDIKNCIITLKNPFVKHEVLSFRLTIPKKASYTIDNIKKPCNITVSQGFNIEYFGKALPDGFSDHNELFSFARTCITDKFTEFFYDLSRNKGTDIMKIGECFKMNFLTNHQWDTVDWEQQFESAEFKVNIYFI